MPDASENFCEFSGFRLSLDGRILFDAKGDVVDLTPKAVEILCVLVEHRGSVVSKDELFRRVWGDSFVEEANLSHHIFRLRKALGETDSHKFIETLPKRGYRFVGSTGAQRGMLARPARRFRVPLIVLAAALLLIVAAILSQWITRRPIETANVSNARGEHDASEIVRVTNSGKVGASSISPDGKFIAYVQNGYDGEGTIYVRQTDTNNELRLLPPTDRIFGGTAFSPDGKFIYYGTYDEDDPKAALYRIPVLGGAPVRLVNDFGVWFSLSADGKRVVFYRRNDDQKDVRMIIASLDDGGEEIVMTRRIDDGDFSGFPAWSPDGRRVAYGAYDQSSPGVFDVHLYSVELTDRSVKAMTDEAWSEIGKMDWRADGGGIVFGGTRPRGGLQIYEVLYPSGAVRKLTTGLTGYGNYGMGVTTDGTIVADVWESSAQIWSIQANGDARDAEQLTSGDSDGSVGIAPLPDGAIAYSSRTGSDHDLWVLSGQGTRKQGEPLTSDDFFEGDITASPDGKFLVFASDRAGNQHLFRIDRSGSNLRQLTFGESTDEKPDISADGKWIVYASWKNNEERIWRLPSEGGEAAMISDHDSLAPAISPDGKFVAWIVPSPGPSQRARLEVAAADTGVVVKAFAVVQFDFNYRPAIWTPKGDALVYRQIDSGIGNLWRQPLAGTAARQFTNFKSDMVFGYAFSTDGKKLLVSRGKRTVNVVLLRHFL